MAVNAKTLEGNWTKIKGKLRERWGHLSGDELESIHGNIEQLIGTIQQKTGEARASIENYLEELTADGATFANKAAETVKQAASNAQETVQDAAKQASDAMRTQYKNTEKTIKQRPMESVAVCFGAGLISGVVLGLMFRSR
jgi:uncharacterized protein YjbJ (UPF0337 family)